MKLSYIICTTQRSGSTLLSSALGQTGIAGYPAEYFVPYLRDELLRYTQLKVDSERDYVPAVIRASTTENGVFGTKLHAIQTRFLLSKISLHKGEPQESLRLGLESEFSDLKYIFLTRKNKGLQAVSFYRATMTGEWFHFSSTANRERSLADKELKFDHYSIEKCRAHLEASDRYWDNYFASHNISPLRLTYEELLEKYETTIMSVLNFLDLSYSGVISPPSTIRIANERSLEWAERCTKLGRIYIEGAEQIEKGYAPF